MIKHLLAPSLAAVTFLLPAAVAADRSDDPRPNIILILADDLGYGQLGSYGQALIQTPELDQLADEGMRFTRMYAGTALCLVSRECLMTGLHVGHSRVRNNGASGTHPPITEEETCISTVLQTAGYRTAMMGKWALGDDFVGHTTPSRSYDGSGAVYKHGWDFYLGEPNQTYNADYTPPYWYRYDPEGLLGDFGSATPVDELVVYPMADDSSTTGLVEDFGPDLCTRAALDFIDASKDVPFFLYLPYQTIHENIEVPNFEPYAASQSWSNGAKTRASLITRLDTHAGLIVDKLADLGIDDDTIVIFTSDNGATSTDDALFDNNGPLSGFKASMSEGGLRVPCIFRWPGRIAPAQVSDEILAFWDFMPTLSALAGIKSPEPIDGISFVPTLLGQPGQQSHDYLFFTLNGSSPYYVVKGAGETRSDSEIFDAAWLDEVIVPTFDPQVTVTAPSELYSPGDPLPPVTGYGVLTENGRPSFGWTVPDGVSASFEASEDLQGWNDAAPWLAPSGGGTDPSGGETRLFEVIDPIPSKLFSRARYEAFVGPARVPDGGVADTTPPNGTGSTIVTEGGSLFLSFDEAVQKGTGNVVIKLAADGSVVETIDVTDAAVVVSGSGVTITPGTSLVLGTSYYVEISSGAFEDSSGNPFAGFSGSSAWSFTVTEAPLFTAYHDFGATTGQESTGFITTHQSGSSGTSKNPLDTSAKTLINYADGSATGVSLFINRANGMDSRDGGECAPPTAGTPADPLFNVAGLNLDNGLIFVGNAGGDGNFPTMTITLSGLSPSVVYDLALYGNRVTSADEAERFTLGGADAATNSSSTGIIDATNTDMQTRPNTGDVVRWTGINPGADGAITILVDPGVTSSTNIAYLSALRLEASSAASGTDIQSDYWYESSVSTDGGGPLDLLAELNYNDGRANAPIAVVMHGYSQGNGIANVRPPAQRLRDNGFFAISVAMRGRDGSDGVRDSGGVEIHDIYDAVEAVKNDPQFAGLIDPTNVHITGYSGGGGNVMSALTKFPDYFRLGSSFFGMSDYGFDLVNGWYNNGAGSRTSQLDIDIGNPNTGGNPVLDRYHARASNLASKNNPYSEIHLFVNQNETICPPWNDTSYRDNAVAAESTPGEFDNITVHIGGTGAYEDFNNDSINDPNELQDWPHTVPNANRQDAAELWYRDRLLSGAIPQPVPNEADILQVPGFVKTGKFDLWLGDGQNAAGELTYSLSDTQMTFTLSIASSDQAVTGALGIDTARMSGETVAVKLNGAQVDSFSGGSNYTFNALGHNDTLVLMTGAPDTIAPTLSTTEPADGTTGVAVGADLIATFSETVQKGTGNITIHKSDDTLVESIDVTTGAVTVSGAEVTINPAADLDPNIGYYVLIASTAIKDAAGNFFAGISDKTAWEFATAAAPAPTWVAYHDFGAYAGEESTGFITTHQSGTTPTTLDLTPKALINYADGSATGVTFSVNQGNGMDPRNAGETGPPAAATPADPLFNVADLNLDSGLFYVGNNTGPAGRFSNQTYTLSGLNPGLTYDLALYGHRNASNDGVERFTLGGADAATNSSSTGIVSTFVTDMNTRPNQATGDVVRWSGINPGADGTITVLVDPGVTSATNIAYLSAMRLEAGGAGP